MELTVERGMGYSLSEERRTSALGIIPTDAIFTPIRRVNYEVFGDPRRKTNQLDKLTLKIWTNGL